MSWPPLRVSKLTFRALALRHSPWGRASARNARFETLYSGQLPLSTHLIIPNYLDFSRPIPKCSYPQKMQSWFTFDVQLKTAQVRVLFIIEATVNSVLIVFKKNHISLSLIVYLVRARDGRIININIKKIYVLTITECSSFDLQKDKRQYQGLSYF